MSITRFIATPLGILCVSIISSIIGTLLYKMGERMYNSTNKKIRNKRFKKYLVLTGKMFCNGYTAAYAKYKSSFHQLLHVNMFTINIMKGILKIVLVAFAAVGLLFVFQEFLFAPPIIIALASIYIAIQYQTIKSLYDIYQIMFDHEFGDDYKKHMMEGVEKYWESITKGKPRVHKEETENRTD